jgi:hypothetical protein
MKYTITSLANPIWADADHTMIDCNISFEHLNNIVMPFTASIKDIEPHGREIFELIKSGKFGPIAEYVPPPEPEVIDEDTSNSN